MGQYGFLIPDRYVREVPGEVDMNTASIFWGFSLGVAVFSVAKASEQSWRAWKRCQRVTSYVAMIWAVWFSSMVLGCLAWGFQRQYIDPSFGFYFSVALFWAIQVQFLLQIILNRLGLLMVVPGRATRLKWIVALVGLMSLPSSLVYLSFHPVCYLLKLQIEMKMAELITKIVRSSGATGKDNAYYHHSSANHAKSMVTNTITKPSATHAHPGVHGAFPGNNTTHIQAGDRDSSIEMEVQGRMSMSQSGIVRTVETTVATSPAQVHDYHRSDSITSSTAGLAF
ncbi:hypothetical protein QSH57_008847 [Fusarium oxysporum f. sp. vasinfectum]|nr:hypothetical protein QSH57_008847 [Fusarium oxysporum f. sp. vasinfectum]